MVTKRCAARCDMNPFAAVPLLLSAIGIVGILSSDPALSVCVASPEQVTTTTNAMTRDLRPCNLPPDALRGAHAANLWPNAVVHYDFDENVTPEQQQQALTAMEALSSVSGLAFVARSEEPDYIHIQDSDTNSSFVGRLGGRQDVNIYNWDSGYIIIHELMHAVGVWHEQQRPDRDQYVLIEWDNIEVGAEHNFLIRPDAMIDGPYDFDSVMHYGACSFSDCVPCSPDDPACRTISTTMPYEECQGQIGQRDHLSAGDVTLLSAMYAGCNWTQTSKLIAANGAPYDELGNSVSLSGDTVIVGATFHDARGPRSGAAYVFDRTCGGWTQVAELQASDGQANDFFGMVALDGDTAVIGAPGDDEHTGSAYVFEKLGGDWIETAKLTALDRTSGDEFGLSVDLSGGTILIGAHGDDDAGSRSGSAYVFRRNAGAWAQAAKLSAEDADSGHLFGHSVSLAGSTALVGAPFAGAAYVFRNDAGLWGQVAKLTGSDGAADDQFGTSVALSPSADVALVGAMLHDSAGINAGAAYVFAIRAGAWTQVAKLTASDGMPYVKFGELVSVSEDTALISAHLDEENGPAAGAAYVFRRLGEEWIQETKLLATDGAASDKFGTSVALGTAIAAVGAHWDDDAGPDSGSLYLFAHTPNCPGDLDGNGAIGLPDLSVLLSGFGSVGDTSYSEGDLDEDGDVDLADLSRLLSAFGVSCL